ncbi:MAG: YceD family protein [Thiolinea sp.]
MSNRLPVEVNPFRLIEQRRQLSGVMPLAQLSRLRELVVQDEGEFAVELDFAHSASGLPLISGQVTGHVELACQRCLKPVPFAIDARINVVVTPSQTDRQPEEEGFEICIVEDDRLFLQDFIEDEILLALPLVPRHEHCEPVRPLREVAVDEQVADDDEQVQPQTERDNPFAVLKDWKKTE